MNLARPLALGALVLLAAFASIARATPIGLEAESLSLPASGGQVVSDSTASGGRALLIWSDATASGTLQSRATRRIAVRARGQSCDGDARMSVAVDGRTVLDTTVSSTGWNDYAADVALNDGSHSVAVSFTNDFSRAGCDRNLLVDQLRLTSVAARPLPGAQLYVDPSSQAKSAASARRAWEPAGAAQLDKIAGQPQAFWFGDSSANVQAAVNGVVSSAAAAGRVPTLVAYDIPERDCGSYSAGGAASASAYRTWIRSFAAGIGSRRAIVILEPDSLAGMDCLSTADQQTRLSLLSDAVSVLAAQANTVVYLDGGHDAWQPVSVMASRLAGAGISSAQGFFLDASNFRAQPGLTTYGQQLAAAIGVAHFVIDTSRNGLGPSPDGEWCNPPGRALGSPPGTSSAYRQDWNLWIKRPGESDGTCNGGPAAGVFWPDYAIGLAQRAAW